MSEKLEVTFTNCTELVRVTAVGMIDTVELVMEGEGVSLKNELIPEPKSSGVGVGVVIISDVIDCDGVICSVKLIAELVNGVDVIMVA